MGTAKGQSTMSHTLGEGKDAETKQEHVTVSDATPFSRDPWQKLGIPDLGHVSALASSLTVDFDSNLTILPHLLSFPLSQYCVKYLPSRTMTTFGAKIIAQALHDLGVKVIFGLPGLPVIDIAQEGLNLGIRFISFRNEQAAAYAATAYGYLTGKPGVCISVGGPGVIHVMAGVRHLGEVRS